MVATRLFSAQPVITAGAYSANDVVGGLLSFGDTMEGRVTFGGINQPGAAGTIRRLSIVDDDNEKAALKLWLFNAAPTAFLDNAAFAPLIADLDKVITIIPIATTDYTTVNANAIGLVENLGRSFRLATDGPLYGYLVTDATPTYAAVTDLIIKLLVWMD